MRVIIAVLRMANTPTAEIVFPLSGDMQIEMPKITIMITLSTTRLLVDNSRFAKVCMHSESE